MNQDHRTLSILTFNIHGERDGSLKDLENFLIESDADIICLQEHNSNVELCLRGYALMSLACGETLKGEQGGYLCNAIFVKVQLLREQTQDVARSNTVFASECDASPPRCAAAIYISGITIVNIHQTGGCGDDSLFEKLVNTKCNQINKLVNLFDPDIIVGDLNAEQSAESARNQMQTYSVYQKLTPERREIYMNYYLGGHNALKQRSYTAAYDEKDVGCTSVYGGTPDWIYTKNQSKKISKVLRVQKLRAIPRLSDHNAILVTFLINNN